MNTSGANLNGASGVPAALDFEFWSAQRWTDGVQLDQLPDRTILLVQTRNSTYEITVVHGSTGEVFVHGGRFFPRYERVCLSGATLRGSPLKVLGIYNEFNMEFLRNGRRIVTSPVCRIAIL